MIEARIRKILQIDYEKRLLIYDKENCGTFFDYSLLLMANDYAVYLYDDIERIRYMYETYMRDVDRPCAIILLFVFIIFVNKIFIKHIGKYPFIVVFIDRLISPAG